MGNGEKTTNRRKHGSHLAPRDELMAGAFTKTFRSLDGFRFLREQFAPLDGARGLLCFAPMTRLVGSEARLAWVMRDVFAQASKLAFVPHEVIKGVLLPESTLCAKCGIDPASGEMLPRVALLDHRCFVGKKGQNMDVVRHDDEVEHLVAVAIEVKKAVGDNVRDFWLAEHAATMAGIERLMPARGEAIMVFGYQIWWESLNLGFPAFLSGINAVEIEPTITIRTPAFENVLRHRVRRAPGDEDHAAILSPMR